METLMNNGICRCCASEGTFKDVTSKYHWMGEEEIYSDMLRYCFDINLTKSESGNDGGICEVCITQLRNAANFKKQVLHTEEQFKKGLQEKLLKSTIVKVEEVCRDDGTESDNNLSEDYSGADYDVPIKEESHEEQKPKKRAAKATTSRAKKTKTEDAETSTKQVCRGDELHCHICDKEHSSAFTLKSHLLQAHGLDVKLTTRRLCDGCGKVFFNAEWLAKHLAVGCPMFESRFCVKCNVVFDRVSDMYKHMRRKHWSEYRLLKLNCPLCSATFKSHEDHDAHLAEEHYILMDYKNLKFSSLEDLNDWKEEIESRDGVFFVKRISACGGQYYHCYPVKHLGKPRVPGRSRVCPARIEVTAERGVLLVHYQSTHVCEVTELKKSITNMLCPMCDKNTDHYEELYSHLAESHKIELHRESMEFTNFDDFLTWKSKIEKQQIVQFYKRSSSNKTRNGRDVEKVYYLCKRSGGTGKYVNRGGLKTGKTCPARISVICDVETGICSVTYQSTHLGHLISPDFLKLTKEERCMLADKIRTGASLDVIVREARNSSAQSRLRDLRKTDLYNVIRDFNIDKKTVNYGPAAKKHNRHDEVKTERIEDEFDDSVDNSNEVCEDESLDIEEEPDTDTRQKAIKSSKKNNAKAFKVKLKNKKN